MKKENDFQIGKVQFQGTASLLLNFLPCFRIVSLGKMTEKTEPFQEDKLNMNFQSNI